jgi:hypothetical protein
MGSNEPRNEALGNSRSRRSARVGCRRREQWNNNLLQTHAPGKAERFELTYCERERNFNNTERINMESMSNGVSFELQRIMERALDAHERKKKTGSQLGGVSWLDAMAEKLERRVEELNDANTIFEDESVRCSLVVAFSNLAQMFRACAKSASNDRTEP